MPVYVDKCSRKILQRRTDGGSDMTVGYLASDMTVNECSGQIVSKKK